MQYLLFYFFSTVALFSGLMVVWSKSAVHSVFFLVLVFFNGSGLILLLGIDFIALIFLVVYVGAIAVLFLFVVMMLAPRIQDEEIFSAGYRLTKFLPTIFLVLGVFLSEIYFIVTENVYSTVSMEGLETVRYFCWLEVFDGVGLSSSNIENIGQVLYTYFLYYFLVAGLVLLVSMIGAIVLTLQHDNSKKDLTLENQQVSEQLSRNFSKALFCMKFSK